jgi:uncharacterized membrane protein
MSEKLYTAIKILAVIGIGLALYLLWQRFFQPEFKPCNINATVNCDAVITGEVANTLGIPTPLIGLIGYFIILFAAFKKNSKLVLGMASFGLLFCLYIGYREVFELRVICPVCLLCLLDMTTVFVLSVLLNRKRELS